MLDKKSMGGVPAATRFSGTPGIVRTMIKWVLAAILSEKTLFTFKNCVTVGWSAGLAMVTISV
jgi:hypothetical protein